MELANLINHSNRITVTFPDKKVVKFNKVQGFHWTIKFNYVADIDSVKVYEFIDAYLQQDELMIKFFDSDDKVTVNIPPRIGGELV